MTIGIKTVAVGLMLQYSYVFGLNLPYFNYIGAALIMVGAVMVIAGR